MKLKIRCFKVFLLTEKCYQYVFKICRLQILQAQHPWWKLKYALHLTE